MYPRNGANAYHPKKSNFDQRTMISHQSVTPLHHRKADCLDEAGGEDELAFVGDDEAHAAAELDAHLALGWVADLNLDEGHVGDEPRLGNG